jgi:hypothetical protein
VKGVAPDALTGGGVLPGHVRIDFGALHCLIGADTATELGRQLLNAATVAQGVASVASVNRGETSHVS